MKRKLVLPIILMTVSAFGLGAGTWAKWSSTQSTGQNHVTTGTLTLEVTGTTINVTGLAPGDCTTAIFHVHNTGSINGKVSEKFIWDSGSAALAGFLDMTLDNPVIPFTTPFNGQTLTSLDALTSPVADNVGTLAAGATRDYTVHACLDPNADNTTQNTTLAFEVNFTIDQL